jgi:hypothetical protein
MAEDIGALIPTSIPSLTENADIQAALRLYHYGTSYDPENTDVGELNPESVAGYLNDLDERVDAIVASGPGSIASTGSGGNTPGVPPTSIVNGFIWVDTNSSLGAQPGLVAAYQSTAPSSPVVGTLWVDSTDTNTPVLKVYNGTAWKAV